MKKTILIRAGIAAVLLVLSAGLSSVSAAAPTVAGYADGTTQVVAAHATAWYTFNYLGGNSPIDIALPYGARNELSFYVYSPDEIARRGWDAAAVGRGNPLPRDPDTLVWSGSFRDAGTYYIQVVNNSTLYDKAFQIAATGPHVWVPTPASSADSSAPIDGDERRFGGSAAATPDTPILLDYALPVNTMPELAIPLPNLANHTLPPRSAVWFSLWSDSGKSATVVVVDGVNRGLGLAVYTDDILRDGTTRPIGLGAPGVPANDLIWRGGSSVSTTRWIRIVNNSANAVPFQMDLRD